VTSAKLPRVVVVNDHVVPDGGADMVALRSAQALAGAGVDVTLFVGDRAPPTVPDGVRLVCTGQGDAIDNARRLSAALQGVWNFDAARGLRKLLSERDPRHTVVHLHSWTKSLSGSVARVALDGGFPVVLTLHDYFSACPNGAFFDFPRNRSCHRTPLSWDCVTTHCDSRSRAFKAYRVVRHLAQQKLGGLPGRIEHFIVVSRFSQSVLAPFLPEQARCHLVRNPIDLTYQPATDVAANRRFVMVARMLAPKGQEVFLQACERAQLEAVCVGDGPLLSTWRERFAHAAFPGPLSRAGVNETMRQARALVMPSLWYETQGLVVDEASALGVPTVVATSCAGCESVIDGETGLHVPGGDVAALASVLRRLADDPAEAARMGQAAHRRFWADPPSLASHAQSLLEVYEGMLRCHRPLSAQRARWPEGRA
jgi:glycosyltransferase involved in cell wall biosynthesis